MHLLRRLAPIVLLASLTSAQTNFFQLFPDDPSTATSFTSRMSATGISVENFAGYEGKILRGLGTNRAGTACEVEQFRVVTQDENCIDQETFNLVFRRPDATGAPRPDPTVAGEILVTGNLMTPPSTASGPCAWQLTIGVGAAVRVPCEGGWYPGIRYHAAPAWPTNGQSIHYASHLASFPVGDNPRPGADDMSWVVDVANASVSRPASGRTPNLWIGASTAVCRVGGNDPLNTRQATPTNYGAGGIYPRITDGLTVQHIDASNPGGFFLVLLGIPGFPGGIKVAGVEGRFWLAPTPLFLLTVGAIGSNGTGSVQIAAPGTLPPDLVGGALCIQNFSFGASNSGSFSNEIDVRN